MILPYWVQVFFVLASGACVGSFLNVVIVRLPRGRSVVCPGSRSFPWRSSIPAYWNIPILSYLIARGRDRKSGLFYGRRYLLVEVITPVLFFIIFWIHGWQMTTLIYCLFVACLVASSFIDLELRIIPDSLTLGAWGVALIFALFQAKGYPISFVQALIGGLAGYGMFWILSRGYYWLTGNEGLGMGDVKFMGFIGSVLGIEGVVITVLVGSFTGAFVGLVFMLFLGKGRRYPIPFGPFLALGALAKVFELDLDLLFSLVERLQA